MFLHACETVIDIVEVGQVEYRRAEEWTSGAVEDTSLAGTATPSPATEPQQAVAQPVNDFSDVSRQSTSSNRTRNKMYIFESYYHLY